VVNFIVDHRMESDDIGLVSRCPWTLFFDGSVCSQGCGKGYVIRSSDGMVHETAIHLEFKCTNNQVEYEALLAGLEMMFDMGAKDIKAFGDSQLVVQQMHGESLCLDGILNSYRDRCMSLVERMDMFHIEHVPRKKNRTTDDLA
jgi:ribonuclease HI